MSLPQDQHDDDDEEDEADQATADVDTGCKQHVVGNTHSGDMANGLIETWLDRLSA